MVMKTVRELYGHFALIRLSFLRSSISVASIYLILSNTFFNSANVLAVIIFFLAFALSGALKSHDNSYK